MNNGIDLAVGNKHIICQYKDNVATFGMWINRNPLNYALPLMLFQLSAISFVSLFIEVLLHPLGQSSIVAQILSGILFGPSVLGHTGILGSTLFPPRSIVTLETLAVFGIMYFLFAIGIRTDTRMMTRPSKQATILGMSAMFITLTFSVLMSLFLRKNVAMDKSLWNGLPFIAASLCLTSFSNVSCLLIELKMASSDLGRIASSTSMLCDVIGIFIVVTLIAIGKTGFDPLKSTLTISSTYAFMGIMASIVGPIMRSLVRRIPSGKPLADYYVMMCFTGVLVAGLATEMIGQHFTLGPLLFGFTVPDGPPLGGPIVSKLDLLIGKFLYPTFLTTSGIKTNIYKISVRSFWIVAFLVMFACTTKVCAVALASRFFNISCQDSIVIGLILNARGVWELLLFNLGRDIGALSDQEFALCVLTVVGVTAIITPLIKILYDPSQRLVPLKRRTIQHSKREAEFRILVCIQNHDNVPSLINLLDASNASEASPIAVIAVILEEVIERITNMLVAHQSTRTLQPNNSRSSHIINALRQYEMCNPTCVTIQSFSTVSHLQTVHDDISRLAIEQNATIVILPFHKRWEIDGSIGAVNKSVQNMNLKIMETAPCSVGILVDRGILSGQMSMLSNQYIYRVAVIYIGGADDAESLCYGARIGTHVNVTLTIIRFLLYGCDSARERKQDNLLIDEVRQQNIENHNFVYQEQVVKDGVGLAASLRALENCFDLLMVGRNHQASQILMGLGAWSECQELGIIGDILSSADFGSTTSVLVVQQQRLRGGDKMMNRIIRPTVISHEAAQDVVAPNTLFTDHNPSW